MNVAMIVAIISFALFVAAMVGEQVDDLRWREVHHEYWGIIALVIGVILSVAWLAWAGALIMADDSVQHAVQRFWRRPASRVSLIYWLVLKPLYKVPGVAELDAWLHVHLQRFFMQFL